MTCPRCGSENSKEGHFCRTCGSPLATPDSAETVIAPPRPSETPLIGRTIEGRYHIDSLLDQGGMGVVYRATRVMIGDIVALKVLHSDKVADADSRERFRREAQAAARLKHPNAVSIYDFGVSSDQLVYLVMELVEGDSLAKIIHSRGALPPGECLEIMRQVTGAVGEAHRHNIIHRDLKPDNIIVNGSGSCLQVKVLDFGIAKLKDVRGTTLTQAGTVVGTPYYMSPEQCLGEELDGRSDIYSLGVVLFEMLTGKLPFSAPTPTAVVIQQVTQPAPSPRSSNPSISLSVERVVMRALEKKREARPETAEQFYQELSVAAAAQGHALAPTEVAPAQPAQTPPGAPLAPTVIASGQSGAQLPSGQSPPQTAGPPAGAGGQSPQPQTQGGHAAPGQSRAGQFPAGHPSGPQPHPSQPRPSHPSGPQHQPGSPSWGGPQYPTANPSAYPQVPARKKSRAATYMVLGFIVLALIILAVAVGYYAANGQDNPSPVPATSTTPTPTPDASSTPTTAETATPTPVPSVNLDSVIVEVNNTLNGWAQAISDRDIEKTMNYYSETLQPYYKLPLATADRARSEMAQAFSQYATTVVQVSNVSVQPSPDGLHASVMFDKTFEFSGGEKKVSGAVQEQMWFSKMGGRWMITGLKDLRTY